MQTLKQRKNRKHAQVHVRPFTVYLDPDMDRDIRELAKKEDRTLTNIAERAFRSYLALIRSQTT